MRLLLDTHVLLWAAASESLSGGALPDRVAALIDDPGNDLIFSAASIWEIVIKAGLGRADFQVNPHVFRRGLLDNGYIPLSITGEHTLAVAALPPLHRDPFDRMLVAQATVEGIMLVTVDPLVAGYSGPIMMV